MRTSFCLLYLYYQILTHADFCLPFLLTYVHSPHYCGLFHMSSLLVFFIVSLILGFLPVCILSVCIFLRSVVFRDFTQCVMVVSYVLGHTCQSHLQGSCIPRRMSEIPKEHSSHFRCNECLIICHCQVDWVAEYSNIDISCKHSRYKPGVAQRVPGSLGSKISWQWHRMVVRLSALRTVRLYPQEIHLVLISVRGWVDPRAIVRPAGLCHWKIPMTPSGIEPATCQFVA
jgi:hypothetical protein